MFKIKNKNIIYVTTFILLLALTSLLALILRTPTLDILKYPLNLLTLLKREISGIVFYHRNLIQNENLKREIDFLKQRINNLNEIYSENTRLKELLYFKQKSSYKVIAARVIGRSPDNWSSAIIIDKGRYNGIKRGMTAITYLGLAGRVIETADSTSKILLISDPNLSVSSLVKRSRQEGLVSGTLGSSLIMKYLPKDSDIQISDVVITSGLTNTYPKGLLIGEVIGIGEEFSGLSNYALIKPAVNLANLEEVLIIIQ